MVKNATVLNIREIKGERGKRVKRQKYTRFHTEFVATLDDKKLN